MQVARVVLRRRTGAAGQAGQDPGAGEPALVGRVVDQHRRAGGGSQHPAAGDVLPHQGVDQGGLARTGRAADHREQRGVERLQARDDVVVELLEQRALPLPRRRRAGQVQRQDGLVDGVAQGADGREQPRVIDRVRHRRKPARAAAQSQTEPPRARVRSGSRNARSSPPYDGRTSRGRPPLRRETCRPRATAAPPVRCPAGVAARPSTRARRVPQTGSHRPFGPALKRISRVCGAMAERGSIVDARSVNHLWSPRVGQQHCT